MYLKSQQERNQTLTNYSGMINFKMGEKGVSLKRQLSQPSKNLFFRSIKS